MKKWIFIILLLFGSLCFTQVIQRFPKPDFQSGYERPVMQTPAPRSLVLEYMDVGVLFIALSVTSYFAHRMRSRRLIFGMMIFTIAYFGFFRKGCICSVGSVQNVVYSFFHADYAIPLTALLFFLLPLVFTLFFGRTFCAAVCPLGAVQDVVVVKPLSLPRWLSSVLSLLPYIYLGFAVLFASVGAGFIICQYDPFVGFFRLGGSFNMIFLGAFLLLLGTIVARPYCRFLCPYGVLLDWFSRLSRRHVRITPSVCINCRLCEASCPFDAIHKPSAAEIPEDKTLLVRRIIMMSMLLPLIMGAGGWMISRLYVPLASVHPVVSLAEEIQLEDSGLRSESSDATRAFRATGRSTDDLFAEALDIQQKVKMGGWFLGGFLGLVFGLKLIRLTIYRRYPEYEIDKGDCLSCGRCFSYCPVDKDGQTIIQLNTEVT